MADNWAPTARLRWVERPVSDPPDPVRPGLVLQQWFTEDVPGYMRNNAAGEWRDVETVVEAHP